MTPTADREILLGWPELPSLRFRQRQNKLGHAMRRLLFRQLLGQRDRLVEPAFCRLHHQGLFDQGLVARVALQRAAVELRGFGHVVLAARDPACQVAAEAELSVVGGTRIAILRRRRPGEAVGRNA